MNLLFIHQNFPGQFKHLAPALAEGGHRVVALTMQKVKDTQWQGVELVVVSRKWWKFSGGVLRAF